MKKMISLFCVITFLLCGCIKIEVAEEENKHYTHGIYELNITQKLLSNEWVGSDWHFQYYYNGEEIKNGHRIVYSLQLFEFMSVDAEITEKDKINDIGTGTITLGLCDKGKGQTEIIVIENAGAFKGNKAVWEITCELKMVGKQ